MHMLICSVPLNLEEIGNNTFILAVENGVLFDISNRQMLNGVRSDTFNFNRDRRFADVSKFQRHGSFLSIKTTRGGL